MSAPQSHILITNPGGAKPALISSLLEQQSYQISAEDNLELIHQTIKAGTVKLVVINALEKTHHALQIYQALLADPQLYRPPILLLSDIIYNLTPDPLDSVIPSSISKNSFLCLVEQQIRFYNTKQEIQKMEIEQDIFFKKTLDRYVSKKVADALISSPKDWGKPQRTQATTLVVDIKDSSRLIDKLTPEQLGTAFSTIHNFIMNIILQYNGTIDKIMGDGLMAVFGIPYAIDNHAQAAVNAAIDIITIFPLVPIQEFIPPELLPIELSIGISTGEVVAGHIGGDQIMDYTAIGKSVTLAFRLEKLTRQYETTILVSDQTQQALDGNFHIRSMHQQIISGIPGTIDVHAIELPRPPLYPSTAIPFSKPA